MQPIVLSASQSKSVREAEKILFVDRAQHRDDGLLHNLILDGGDPSGRCRPSALGMFAALMRIWPLLLYDCIGWDWL
jgi:hypothetical protein